jgi:transcription termination factor Rho
MTVTGVLQVLDRRGGFLRDPSRSFVPSRQDVFVPAALIDRFRLVSGAMVAGTARPERQGTRLDAIQTVCGVTPDAFRDRTPFDKLTATNPDRRFRLGTGGNVSMRIIDLFAPIGRGTRGLIVSPPKAGKTQLLEELAQAILSDAPDTQVMVMLVDERPEEVTHFRRQVAAEVLASSSDQSLEDHVQLATMCMDKARCGLDSRALEIPRKFFGMARNVEGGGSITILATALIETGSRMDDMIFEEFKGTGNSEIVLDRALADQRVFPALNISKSGTRRDELLYSKDDIEAINKLRRGALGIPPKQAIVELRKAMEEFPTNEELLKQVGRAAAG